MLHTPSHTCLSCTAVPTTRTLINITTTSHHRATQPLTTHGNNCCPARSPQPTLSIPAAVRWGCIRPRRLLKHCVVGSPAANVTSSAPARTPCPRALARYRCRAGERWPRAWCRTCRYEHNKLIYRWHQACCLPVFYGSCADKLKHCITLVCLGRSAVDPTSGIEKIDLCTLISRQHGPSSNCGAWEFSQLIAWEVARAGSCFRIEQLD